MSTFVSVGNATQPFSRLLDAVIDIAPTLPQPVVFQYGNNTFTAKGFEAYSFVDMMKFKQLVSEAELLILHAGAGSVIHAVRSGKVPIVMPRRTENDEHVDNHQIEFSCVLEAMDKIVVVDEISQFKIAVKHALHMQKIKHKIADKPKMIQLVGETLAKYAERYE
jgi:beta-1,4-N-acetylglucosaminyltransferase